MIPSTRLNHPSRVLRHASFAFSLIELTVVLVILGVIMAIAVPRYQDGVRKATVATLVTNTARINEALEQEYQAQVLDNYPDTIDPAWFANGKLPAHPGNSLGEPPVQVVTPGSGAGVIHPTSKVLKAGVGGAYWYNPDMGVVRARVRAASTAAQTLAEYNQINLSNETALGNYGGGGGGS